MKTFPVKTTNEAVVFTREIPDVDAEIEVYIPSKNLKVGSTVDIQFPGGSCEAKVVECFEDSERTDTVVDSRAPGGRRILTLKNFFKIKTIS